MTSSLKTTGHVQDKVQAELDNVLGPDRPPTMQDKLSLPYTEVTLKGLLSSIMPVSRQL